MRFQLDFNVSALPLIFLFLCEERVEQLSFEHSEEF